MEIIGVPLYKKRVPLRHLPYASLRIRQKATDTIHSAINQVM